MPPLPTADTREHIIAEVMQSRFLPAFRTYREHDLVALARAVAAGGARVVEITMTSPGVLEAVEELSAGTGPAVFVGVGTVLDASTADQAISAGARFVVTPVTRAEVVDVCRERSVACLIGALTPTEVLTALEADADLVKVFPASSGGPRHVEHLMRVMPTARLIPSGGITPESAPHYLAAGAVAVSGARGFLDPASPAEQITADVAATLARVRRATTTGASR